MQANNVSNCISCGKPAKSGDTFCNECSGTLLGPGIMATQTDNHSASEITSSVLTVDGPNDDLIGLVLADRYLLKQELGRGGMGTVYRATRLQIGDEVAVKILHPDLVADPQAAERFRREAQASARLKHPNVVSVYDFGVSSDGLFFLVTELADGQSLRQLLSAKKALPATVASEIVLQICAALDEAHSRQIIHRDIKPDNIIVNESAAGWRVKVLDFGLAKIRDAGTENLTQTSNLMGTPYYMSPEQCLGEELDARSDVYSVGIVLYELLCGGVPFDSPMSTAVVVQHVNQAPPSLRAINASIPSAVEAIVMRALAKQRDARPRTAGALAQELVAAVGMGVQFQPAAAKRTAPTVPFVTQSGPINTPGYSPTTVMPATARIQPSGINDQPGSNGSSKALIFLAALLAIMFGGVLSYLIVRDNGADTQGTTNESGPATTSTRGKNTPSTSATSGEPPAAAPQTAPANRPANAMRFALSMYSGVNVRAEPSSESLLLTTIGKNQGVWVFEESQNYDTVTIKSEARDVTDNWSRVELANNPSVRGWVFSGFLSKK